MSHLSTSCRRPARFWLAVATLTAFGFTSTAHAQDSTTTTAPADCPPNCSYDIRDERDSETAPLPGPEMPDTSPNPDNEGDNGGGGGGEPVEPEPLAAGECRDPAVFPPGGQRYENLAEQAGPPPDDDHVLMASYCGVNSVGDAVPGVWQDPFWTPLADAPDPEEAALQAVEARVRGNLPVPEVSTNPVGDRPTIIGLPVFITVDNWPTDGVYEDSEGPGCGTPGGVCATVTAEATLWYDPGEPGTTPFQCLQPPGAPYDRNHWNDDPFHQANQPETCTHAYTTRTGTNNRPDHWPAQVEIRWTLTGHRGSTGETEDLGTDLTTTPIPRQVNEVHTTITD